MQKNQFSFKEIAVTQLVRCTSVREMAFGGRGGGEGIIFWGDGVSVKFRVWVWFV